MKKEYDFTKGERGKFHRADAKLNLPIYLDPEILGVVERIAWKRHSDVSTVVNELLRTDIELARALK